MSTPDLYSILEISKTANDEEIKKGYKKAALKHHPDRNPNNPDATAKFQEVGKAFATLGDPEKRKRYDQFGVIDGENDGNGGMPGGMNPFDIFQSMFGGGGMPGMGGGMPGGIPGMFGGMFGGGQGGQGGQPRNFKSPDKKVTINLSLSDVYNGKSVGIDFVKIICCDSCEGSGALNKECIKTCKSCNGQGRIVRMMQMGPMIQQSVQPCGTCSGKGKTVEAGKECIKCKGKKCNTIKRHVDCYVKAGTQAGTSITFKNESDWVQDCNDIGDLVVFVNSKNEEGGFRREGNNLIMKKSILLLEALIKTEFYFKHLDERVIKITHENIIKPNQKMIVKGEGMNDQNNNGDLLIYFDVIFPTSLDKDRSKYLVKILPLPKKQIWDLQFESMPKEDIMDLGMEYCEDEEFDKKEKEKDKRRTEFNIGNINNAFDEDDENGQNGEEEHGFRNGSCGGGRPVECATQ
jgi:DnaJ family protein A protein 2